MKAKITSSTLLLAAAMFMASCGSKQSENKNISTEQTTGAVYQCPMKCEGDKTYDKPGQCPVCNMDLRKVEESHEHHDHDTTEHHNH